MVLYAIDTPIHKTISIFFQLLCFSIIKLTCNLFKKKIILKHSSKLPGATFQTFICVLGSIILCPAFILNNNNIVY